MKLRRLLDLYPRAWRERYGAEIAEVLGHERPTIQLVVDLIRGALDARLHPELAGPILATAGGGTVQMPSRSPLVRLVLVVLLLVFAMYGGLYVTRSQKPAVPSVPLTQLVSEVQAGRVASIEIENYVATATLFDGTRLQAVLGSQQAQDQLSSSVGDHNRTDPAHQVQLLYQPTAVTNAFAPLLPLLLGLLITALPIALAALLLVLVARRLAQKWRNPASPSRYEWLARIAELRDRGVLTEDEFLREKERILR